MGSAKERVHPRYRVDLAATARWRRVVLSARVCDVSLMGAFVAGEEHPNLRELVRLELELPGRAEPFSVHGMAVNFAHVGDVDGRPPGFGVQLYAMDREMQRAWAQFIDLVKKGGLPRPVALPVVPPPPPPAPRIFTTEDELPPLVIPEPLARTPIAHVPQARPPRAEPPAGTRAAAPPPQPPARAPAPPPAPARAVREAPLRDIVTANARVSPAPRTPSNPANKPGPISLRPGAGGVEFEVELRSAEELALFFERDASVGGMFIPTDLDLRVRSTLKVFLVHPDDGSTFELDARVSHVECDLDAPGVGVEFIGFTEPKRAALRAFVYGGEAPAPAPAPRAVEGIWDFEPQGPPPALEVPPAEDDALARLFEPWSGAESQRLWSTPPDEEFAHLFDALDEHEASGLRRSRAPSALPAAEEEAPDFRLSMPSWTKLEAAPSPVTPVDDVVDLSDDASLDLVEATPLPQNVDGWARRHVAR